MSQQPISHSPDLQRLRDEGFELEVRSGHLLVTSVPYLTASGTVDRGTLVMPLTLAGDIANKPGDHTAWFIGSRPYEARNVPFRQIINETGQKLAEGLDANFQFSSKPPGGAYSDFYEKVTTYVGILQSAANTIEPEATAKTHQPVVPAEGESVFCYLDTASSRAGIAAITQRLQIPRVAIVGLGGSGSYVLDLIAKCPIGEIHPFDGDDFLSHNAFRAPGAASLEELRLCPNKAKYFAEKYSKMHRHIIPHDYYVDATNVEELRDMNFVFLCLDRGSDKKVIIEKLEEWNLPFIDVGMGVEVAEGMLMGIVRVTTSSNELRSHVWDSQRIPFSDGDEHNEYGLPPEK